MSDGAPVGGAGGAGVVGAAADAAGADAADTAGAASAAGTAGVVADAVASDIPAIFEGKPVPFRPFPKWRLDRDRVPPQFEKDLVDYTRFATVPPKEGEEQSTSDFSSTLPAQSLQTNRILKIFLQDPVKGVAGPHGMILDLTAHIGADTANTARLFPKSRFLAMEIDPLTAAVHKRNMEVLGLADRVETRVGDSVEAIEAGDLPKADLALVDPPWGGPEYFKLEKTMPEMGGRPFSALVAELMRSGTAAVVASKLPTNLDVDTFRAAVQAVVPTVMFYDWEIIKRRRGRTSTSFRMHLTAVNPEAVSPALLKKACGLKEGLATRRQGTGRGRGRGLGRGRGRGRG